MRISPSVTAGFASDGPLNFESWALTTRAPRITIQGIFFFIDTATTEIYTLSLHDALPITDGRDVANGTAGAYLGQLQRMLGAVGVGRIASVVGRNYAMDKSGQQSLTNAACELILDGAAEQRTDDAVSAASGHAITDDGWLPPVVVD